MTDQIRVRIVPKTTEGESFGFRGSFSTFSTGGHRLRADGDRALAARHAARDMGIDLNLTPQSTLEGLVSRERFSQIFGTELVERTREDLRGHRYLAPTAELRLPDALVAVASFAYLPTPPQYFAETHIPPSVSVYHLRLEDVVRVLRASRCHRRGWTAKGVRIAMADTGFARHPFFDHHGYNIQRISTSTAPNPALDSSGHGTGESANILATAPDCQFFGVKHDDFSALALETSIAQNPKIMVNSWGWDIDNQSMDELRQSDPNQWNELRDVERILLSAIEDGVIVIFAGGNGHRAFPACIPDVIAVGGVTVAADGTLQASSYASSFLSRLYPGRRVPDFCGVVGEASASSPLKGHIMLPVPSGAQLEGENLPAAHRQKGWGIFSGTSAAAPQVAGIVGLMVGIKPELTQEGVRQILSSTTRDVTNGRSAHGDQARAGADEATGAGFVDAFAACLMTEQIGQQS
jgi:serine protease AprX